MRPFYRLLTVAILALPLVIGVPPVGAHDDEDDDEHGGLAPEIDPGLLRGGAAIFAGGLLILRDRRRR